MIAHIAGFVLRSKDRHLTARFYAELGLSTHDHEHGGPRHYETGPLSEDFVVEVYQASEHFPGDALMLEVSSIEHSLEVSARFGVQIRTSLRDLGEVKIIYITDPDGRDVMLIEKK